MNVTRKLKRVELELFLKIAHFIWFDPKTTFGHNFQITKPTHMVEPLFCCKNGYLSFYVTFMKIF